MELTHVRLDEWPHDGGPGGWVVPIDDRLSHWTVTAVHAVYEAPDGIQRGQDPWGNPVPSDMLRAYLVDLDGGSDVMRLPSMERVLLHRIPRKPHWWIKSVDGAYLEAIGKYRIS
ncbi:hypothetical protein ACFWYW_55470 [Nonomuraea sp. NPDC059023]|uniref:hypothetical protein n=1 Tax=unclassified Nonomuraea TaxID=2593643 RepID=UPI0036B8E466